MSTDQTAAFLEAELANGSGAPGLHFQPGLAYEQLGHSNTAAREFQDTLRLNPTNDEAKKALARFMA